MEDFCDKNLERNETVTVTATDLTTDGAGVGRVSGQVVFVPGLLPTETADVHIIKPGKRYCVGKIARITEFSPHRVAPICPVFAKCGGCTLQHLNYQNQLEYKRNHVASCLKKIAHLDFDVPLPIPSSPYRYRNKTALAVDWTDELKIGYYAAHSHNIADGGGCVLGSESAEKIANVMRELIEKFLSEKRELVRRIVLREGDGVLVGLVVRTLDESLLNIARELCTRCSEVVGVVANINDSDGNVILSDQNVALTGRSEVTIGLCGLKFSLGLNSFLQVNTKTAEVLYKTALDMAQISPTDIVHDLYCGIGTISLIAAKRANEVHAVEIARAAIRDAKKNAERNNIRNVRFYTGDVAEVLPKLPKPDVVIVDPPRKGLDPGVLLIIAQTGARVCYISCDPATLARDVAVFCELGYRLSHVAPVDMFPQTAHIETVCVLE